MPLPAEMTRIESDPAQLQSHINFFQQKGAEKRGARRLFLVFSRSFKLSDPPLTVPDSFCVCEITCCFGAQALFDQKTTYCGIPLPSLMAGSLTSPMNSSPAVTLSSSCHHHRTMVIHPAHHSRSARIRTSNRENDHCDREGHR